MAKSKKPNYAKLEEFDPGTTEELSLHYREILRLIGENPDREGLLNPGICPRSERDPDVGTVSGGIS
jgi:hypothetical protein